MVRIWHTWILSDCPHLLIWALFADSLWFEVCMLRVSVLDSDFLSSKGDRPEAESTMVSGLVLFSSSVIIF